MIKCMWCKRVLGSKQGTGTIYVMCPECLAKLRSEIVTLRRHLIGAERATEKILKNFEERRGVTMQTFNLIGKEVILIKGDHKEERGKIVKITGYTEAYGVVAKIKLSNKKVVEYSADFWEIINNKGGDKND